MYIVGGEYMSKKIYSSREEMLDKEKFAKSESLKELNRLIAEDKKLKNKSIIKIVILTVLLIILFKLLIGEINLSLPTYRFHQMHDVTLNEELITICIDEEKKSPIIPFFINNVSFDLICYYHDIGNPKNHTFNIGDEIKITVDSFECFNSINGDKASCYPYEGKEKRPVKKIDYSLSIVRNYKGQKVIYTGDFINDISDYFLEKGTYTVSIISKYRNVKSNIFFSLKIVD